MFAFLTENKEKLENVVVDAQRGEIIDTGKKAFSAEVLRERAALKITKKNKEKSRKQAVSRRNGMLLQKTAESLERKSFLLSRNPKDYSLNYDDNDDDEDGDDDNDDDEEVEDYENTDDNTVAASELLVGEPSDEENRKNNSEQRSSPSLSFHFPTGNIIE